MRPEPRAGLAFGSLDHMQGQVVGKAYMVLPAVILVGLLRSRRTVAVA